MRHFSFLILVIASGLFVRAQSPNILLIIADDLGVDALNGYNLGSINPTTPHLDSLRNNGLTFTNVWSSPVCSPTRAGIMSGKYGIKNGVKTVPG
ncbi:MAG TPA: sulfatase, partial [Flavobacteriales bacterium]|nr:sulfatase [Flavobacteriales bacterium]